MTIMRPVYIAIEILIITLVGSSSLAETGLTLESVTGTTISSQTLGLDGKFGSKAKREDSIWGWNFSTVQADTKSEVAEGVYNSENSYESDLGIDWSSVRPWRAGATMVYSTTPVESLTNNTVGLSVGYRHEFKGPEADDKAKNADEEEELPFHNVLDFSLAPNFGYFLQTYNGQVQTKMVCTGTKKNRVCTPEYRNEIGQQDIKQQSFKWALKFKAFKWLSFAASVKPYYYNKDPAVFLQGLNSAKGVQAGASGFASAVSGLPARDTEVDVDFYYGRFELLCSYTMSASASDTLVDINTGNLTDVTAVSTTKRVELGVDVSDDLHVAVGWQQQYSPITVSNAFGIDDNQLILGLSYYF